MNLALLAALGQVAEKHKKNDFLDYSDQIAFWIKDTFGLGRRYTFLVNVGDKLTFYENESTGGENFRTMLVGDKTTPYLRINDHGTGLKGLVSVHLSAVKEAGQVRISLDAYPLTVQDTPLVGIIWFDDLFTLGNSPACGNTHVWSADHLIIPIPDPLGPAANHLIQGFSFGMVMADPEVESIQIINRLEQIGIMSPVGFSERPLSEEFVIADTRKFHQPDDMTDIRFRIVEMLYGESIAILSQEEITRRFTRQKSQFNANEIAKFVLIINRMVSDGWFSKVAVQDRIYFVPTPKLLFNM